MRSRVKKHGGKRKGAGRKGFGGTTLVRVPNGILKLVKKIIADWKAAESKAF